MQLGIERAAAFRVDEGNLVEEHATRDQAQVTRDRETRA